MCARVDSWNLHTHAIRRHYISCKSLHHTSRNKRSDAIVTAMIWMTVHLPFIMGYILAAASLSRLVLATDCHDANAEDLTESYISNSQGEVPTGLRWFYCGGLGIALLCMSTHP